MADRPARTTRLSVQLSPEARQALSAAARAARRPVGRFVLESALARAAEILAERPRFSLDPGRWAAFQAALDAPPRRLPRLRRLFGEAMPFDGPEGE